MDDKKGSGQFGFGKGNLLPQEEMLEVGKRQKKLIIGIPKESQKDENRVALTPEAVGLLVDQGHDVNIETKAGIDASYLDTDYSEYGGFIVENRKEVFNCDVVLKIAPLSLGEIEYLKGNQVIISSLHATSQTESYIRKLMQKKVTAIAFENLKDKFDCYPVVRSMSEIAGITSVLIASEYLSNVHKGKGVMLGGITGITPAEVIILGAGTAAEYAARAAIGLGAEVKIFDNSIHKLRRLQNYVGQRLHTSIFHPRVLEKTLKSADVVIGAVHLIGKGPRFYVTEEMVKGMKKGSVIVDISIDQGGCVETSEYRNHNDPVFTKHGVVHYCVSNIPSRVARTASIALSNVFAPILRNIGDAGGIKAQLKEDQGLRKGVYIYNGILTNSYLGQHFGILSKDIDLLLAAF
ncbi:MAG: alanine dehydrogenase [Bacteroidales bacterium]|nr:MAG: alanine dehydrogenase [Bacteroidales bacterium]